VGCGRIHDDGDGERAAGCDDRGSVVLGDGVAAGEGREEGVGRVLGELDGDVLGAGGPCDGRALDDVVPDRTSMARGSAGRFAAGAAVGLAVPASAGLRAASGEQTTRAWSFRPVRSALVTAQSCLG
jgi:hypothetical protein